MIVGGAKMSKSLEKSLLKVNSGPMKPMYLRRLHILRPNRREGLSILPIL
jgi:hypothetical protein